MGEMRYRHMPGSGSIQAPAMLPSTPLGGRLYTLLDTQPWNKRANAGAIKQR